MFTDDPTIMESCSTPITSEYASDPDMSELIELFIADLRQRVDDMLQAVESGDHRQLHVTAHQLKGSAGGHGFPGITNRAADLEAALIAETGDSPAIGHKAASLIAVCRRAIGDA